MPMTAYEMEKGLDELFGKPEELTPKQAEIVGAFRAMLWEKQEQESRAFEKAFTGAH